MSSKAPPVPAENRSPKGPGEPDRPDLESASDVGGAAESGNAAKQGQSGNIHVNTTHQGHQQDR